VHLELSSPLVFDSYRRNRLTGSLIVMDEATNETVAAGVILDIEVEEPEDSERKRDRSPNVRWQGTRMTRGRRWNTLGHGGATLWFTGLPGAGKSTIASAVEERLIEAGRPAFLLDGDNLRHGLNGDLGFSAQDRAENVRRVAEVARLCADAGLVVCVPVISPYRAGRAHARSIHEASDLVFVEVFVDAPLAVCEARDPKGLYRRARAGELRGLTGVDDPYEAPTEPDLVLASAEVTPPAAAERIVAALAARGVVA
jgi:bifunctional enzyme CysN/CysC